MTTTEKLDLLCAGKDVSETRRESMRLAIEAGADDATLAVIRDALRVARRATIVLPGHRYEGLSRGRGWCRRGTGANATWDERTDDGYRVDAGHWSVGATDGFSRKGSASWTVRHVSVGPAAWTVAS